MQYQQLFIYAIITEKYSSLKFVTGGLGIASSVANIAHGAWISVINMPLNCHALGMTLMI